MANRQTSEYKKEIRQANNSKKRQALFIAEYIQVKYNQMYNEAAELYNKINAIYPDKPDLRKSVEFKNWKLVEAGKPTIRPHVPRDPTQKCIYGGITIDNKEKETNEEIIATLPGKTLQLRIPLMSPESINEITHVEEHEQVMNEGQQGSDQDQERWEVDNVQPSVFEHLSNETVDEMIQQLREDPELCAIMDDIDIRTFNGLDLGMEIDIEDRLEQELNEIM